MRKHKAIPFDGPAAGETVLRGGSWNNDENNARVDYRNNNNPNNANNNYGLRVVLGSP